MPLCRWTTLWIVTTLNNVINLPAPQWQRLVNDLVPQQAALILDGYHPTIQLRLQTTGLAPSPPASLVAGRRRPAIPDPPRPTCRCRLDAAPRSLLPAAPPGIEVARPGDVDARPHAGEIACQPASVQVFADAAAFLPTLARVSAQPTDFRFATAGFVRPP